MITRRSLLTLSATALLAASVAGPVTAQSPSAPAAPPALSPPASVPAGPAITVIGQDYHFAGLPTSVPVGATLTLDNQGTEVHELIIVRRNDGVTQTWDELLAMPNEQAFQYITMIGTDALVAAPGETAAGSIVIPQTGDYLAVCFIPQGMTALPGPSTSPDPALQSATPHFALGMVQAFTGTEAGTEPGPLPSAAPMGSMAPAESAAP